MQTAYDLFRVGMRLVFCSLAVFIVTGCSSVDRDAWISAKGGVLQDARQMRVEWAGGQVRAAAGLCANTLRLRVLDHPGAVAYSFRDGTIFVSRGLVDLLDDNELLAAIAHEVGHLINDKHIIQVAALEGDRVSPHREAAADRAGCTLLEMCGKSDSVMSGMLRKVASCGYTPSGIREALIERAALIEMKSTKGAAAAPSGDAAAGRGSSAQG